MGWRVIMIIRNLVLVLLVVLALTVVLLSSLATAAANKVLPKMLEPPASVRRVTVGLLRGHVGVRDIRVGQPAGFGEPGSEFFHLGSFDVNLALRTLKRGPIRVQRIEVDDLFVHVVRDKQGRLNVQHLLRASEGVAGEAVEGGVEAPNPPPPTGAGPSIWIEKVAIKRGLIRYTDLALDEKPVELQLADVELDVRDLRVNAADAAAFDPALITLTALFRGEGIPDGRIGLDARVGPLGGSVPAVRAAARVVGLDFAPVKALVPPGVMTALGGTALDLRADVAVNTNLLDVSGVIVMDGGSRFPFSVGGTPEKPSFDSANILYGAFGRVGSGLVLGTAKDVACTAGEVAGTAVDTAGAVVGGAWKTVSAFGKAVKDTAVAGAHGDLSGVASGLVDTVAGTAGAVKDTVVDTAGTAAEGVVDSTDALRGKTAQEAWRAMIDERWLKQWEEARAWVAEPPFPPVSKEQER